MSKPLPQTQHMRPGGIQDESSKEEQQEMQERCLTHPIQDECRSDAYQKKGLCKFTMPVEQLFAQDNDAVLEPKLEFQRDCWNTSKLTPARRVQLADLMFRIYHQAAWMGEIILAADNSELIDPLFLNKVLASKNHLEVVALAVKDYKQRNKEAGTPQIKRGAMAHLTEARKQCTYLARILGLPIM